MNLLIPKGSLATPITQLRTMVSLSKEFQRETNSDTATDALKQIGLTRVGEGKRGRPFACIMIGDSHSAFQIAGGSKNFLIPEGNIGLYLTKDVNPLYRFDVDLATLDFANFAGTVADEIVELSGDNNSQSDISHLPITRHLLTNFGDSGDDEKESLGDFFYAVYLFDWGIAG